MVSVKERERDSQMKTKFNEYMYWKRYFNLVSDLTLSLAFNYVRFSKRTNKNWFCEGASVQIKGLNLSSKMPRVYASELSYK